MKIVSTERVGKPGKKIEIISQKVEVYKDNQVVETFNAETTRRPPGVRIILIKENKILLNHEYRLELNSWDWRVPGGKVFNKLKDYLECPKTEIMEAAKVAARLEAHEEIGVTLNSLELCGISNAGSSIIWDLYYFTSDDFDFLKDGKNLEVGELISESKWFTYKQIVEMCKHNIIQEGRSVAFLLRSILERRELQWLTIDDDGITPSS